MMKQTIIVVMTNIFEKFKDENRTFDPSKRHFKLREIEATIQVKVDLLNDKENNNGRTGQ